MSSPFEIWMGGAFDEGFLIVKFVVGHPETEASSATVIERA